MTAPGLGGHHDGIIVDEPTGARTFSPPGGMEIVVDERGAVIHATWELIESINSSERIKWRYFIPAHRIIRIWDRVVEVDE